MSKDLPQGHQRRGFLVRRPGGYCSAFGVGALCNPVAQAVREARVVGRRGVISKGTLPAEGRGLGWNQIPRVPLAWTFMKSAMAWLMWQVGLAVLWCVLHEPNCAARAMNAWGHHNLIKGMRTDQK